LLSPFCVNLSPLMSVLKWIGVVLGAIILLLLLWGVLIEPRFLLDQQDYTAEVTNLPPTWEGQRIALLADFQVGMWWDNTGMVAKAIEAAIEAQPALVLIAGDFVYKPDSAKVRKAVDLVRPLTDANVPTYAVLGNHDYSMTSETSEKRVELARYLAEELEAAGIEVLENEAVPVEAGADEPLYVVGLGSAWADEARPLDALADVPFSAARVIFMHNPITFRDLPAQSAPFTLTAHTHGGQVRVPFTPSSSWLDIAREREVIADGWAADSIGATGNRAYVNRGIGFSIVPARVRARPELSLFTLQRSGGTLPERGPETDTTAAPTDSAAAATEDT
jgi:predicted MPP superfamily phosphohydrolase